jgi:putative nucleotidyltransferase with HDIG domain
VIKPAWDDTLQTGAPIPKPASKDILNTIQELKPIPQTALKIFRMFHSGQNNFAQITEELSKDQVLSGQTLKLCNSALFSGRIKIDTLKDAVLLLGEEMLIKSVITAAVNNYYHQAGSSGYSLCKGGLFFHAVGVAATAEKIAEKCKSEHTKSAYTTGLLHDIGKVVLDQFVADRSPLLFRKLAQEDIDFIQAEKKILGISHTEVGALLAKEWKFSEGLSEVILLHHNPENAVKRKELAYIIYLADLLIEKFHAGFDLEKMQSHSFKDALDCIGLTLEDLPGLIDTIPINAINTMDNLNS